MEPGADQPRADARSGHTLLELATVLAILAVATAVAAGPLGRWRDLATVVAARESVAGLIAAGRATAVARGGATVYLSVTPPRAALVVDADTVRVVDLDGDGGVHLDLGARTEVSLRYDEVGIGRLASATIRFARGEESRSLVVSSFGRVRRQ